MLKLFILSAKLHPSLLLNAQFYAPFLPYTAVGCKDADTKASKKESVNLYTSFFHNAASHIWLTLLGFERQSRRGVSFGIG